MTTPSRSFLKAFIPILAVILLVGGGLLVVRSMTKPTDAPSIDASSPDAPAQIHVGAQVPDFDPTQFGGGDIHVSQLKSKVKLVNFWATWCEACMVEMPSIVKLYEAYKTKGFDVIGINLDDDPEVVLPKTIKRLSIGFPIYLDKANKASDIFDVHAIPVSVVLDQNRKILMIETGERDWFSAEFRAQLEKWLSG